MTDTTLALPDLDALEAKLTLAQQAATICPEYVPTFRALLAMAREALEMRERVREAESSLDYLDTCTAHTGGVHVDNARRMIATYRAKWGGK